MWYLLGEARGQESQRPRCRVFHWLLRLREHIGELCVCVLVHVCVCVCACVCMCMCVRMFACAHACTCTHVCIYACMHACIYVCMMGNLHKIFLFIYCLFPSISIGKKNLRPSLKTASRLVTCISKVIYQTLINISKPPHL
jgi:hypothetical protein